MVRMTCSEVQEVQQAAEVEEVEAESKMKRT